MINLKEQVQIFLYGDYFVFVFVCVCVTLCFEFKCCYVEAVGNLVYCFEFVFGYVCVLGSHIDLNSNVAMWSMLDFDCLNSYFVMYPEISVSMGVCWEVTLCLKLKCC